MVGSVRTHARHSVTEIMEVSNRLGGGTITGRVHQSVIP
jgi:hypothetical protein